MVFKWKQYTVTIIVITLMTMYCKLAAQTSPKNFKDANELILAGSIQATSVNKREFIEKQSNDAVTASTFHSALSHWKKELAKDSTNANLNYKTGLCYFFSYDQQLKAMPYFKKAIKGLTDTYDFNNQKETKAPYSAYYFLADTYLENNQPDSAIKYFSMYQDNYQTIPISAERGVFMSINAKESEKHPRNVNVATLGNAINTSFAETNPVMKLDNKLLFFSSRRPNNQQTDTTGDQVYDADIYFATKNENNKWSNVSPFTYNTEFDEAPLYLSPNGDVLYFRKTIKNNTDIFKTELVNNVWTKPQPVNEINTPFNETGVSISGDGKYLYFCSDQNKVAGMYDIFKCTKQANGKWGKLEILSTTINTPFNEVSPYVSPDGKTLFFSSNGSSKKGIGSYDIYYSELKSDSTWTEPNNLGYPINKCRADINYYVAGDDKRYFSSLTENNSYDIFIVEGGGFDFENIAAGTEVVTVTNEMGVTQVMETEKQVEKEVEVTQAVETIVEKEKEVEVIKTVEVEKTSDPITSTDSNTKTETGEKKNELIIDGTILNTENTNDFVRDVKVFLLDHEGKRIQATKTNDKGYFAFEELDPEKTYMAEVETTEDNLKNKARYYLADKNGKITRMTHDNGETQKFVFKNLSVDPSKLSDTFDEGLEFSGNILSGEKEKPLANKKVTLTNAAGDIVYKTTTNSSGAFDFKNLPIDQSYYISIDDNTNADMKFILTNKDGKKLKQTTSDEKGQAKFSLSKDETSVINDLAVDKKAIKENDPKDVANTKTESPKEHLNVEGINLDKLDDASKIALIDKVKRYLTSELKENETVLYKTVYFDVNKTGLKPMTITELKLLVDYMKEKPEVKIEIVGHTDNTGKWAKNNELSINRANQVYEYLVSKYISPMRLHYYGKGSTTPFSTNDTEEGKAKNRRVEIILIK